MRKLIDACSEVLAAQQALARIVTYERELPQDPTYDLGIRVQVAWNSAAAGGDDNLNIEKRLSDHLRENFRVILAHEILRARQRANAALEELKQAVASHA